MGFLRFVLRVLGSGLGSGDIFAKVVLRRSRTRQDLPSQLRKNMENEMEALDPFRAVVGIYRVEGCNSGKANGR